MLQYVKIKVLLKIYGSFSAPKEVFLIGSCKCPEKTPLALRSIWTSGDIYTGAGVPIKKWSRGVVVG